MENLNELLKTIPNKITKNNIAYRIVIHYDIYDMWQIGYYNTDLHKYLNLSEYIGGYASELNLAIEGLIEVLKRKGLI